MKAQTLYNLEQFGFGVPRKDGRVWILASKLLVDGNNLRGLCSLQEKFCCESKPGVRLGTPRVRNVVFTSPH